MPQHVSNTCVHHHEVKIALHSLWYHHTYRSARHQEVKIALHSLWYHHTYRYVRHQEVKIALHSLWYHHSYSCDDTRDCVMQFWPHDDEHMCSKHVEAWNKLIVKQTFCASSWLITEKIILRCTVSKTSKNVCCYYFSLVMWGSIRTVKLLYDVCELKIRT